MPAVLMPAPKPLLMLFAALTLAACGATTSTQPMPVATTPEKIKGDCWMKYEGDAKMSIDKRATLVDACVAEQSKARAPIN
jgi:hypothetical protein